jgi:4-carboxymuconolactone decarboxylase
MRSWLAATALSLLFPACARPAQTVPTYADVRAVSPALERYTKETLLGEAWKRPGLSPRDRSLVTLAVLVARNQTVELPFHLELALDNGLRPAEISELITHLAFYAGWANATSAVLITRDVFARRGITTDQLPAASGGLLPIDRASEAKRAAFVEQSFGQISPGVVHFTTDALFHDLWLRPGLAPRDRSLSTVAALVATGQTAQLASHLGRAMDNGVTRGEIAEVLTQLAFYTGWPFVFSALPVVKDTLEKRDGAPAAASAAPPAGSAHLEVQRPGSQPATPGDATLFTGSATVTPLFGARPPTHTSAGSVTFAPGARGHWHTHPAGQILIITAGTGWVQEWGGPKIVVKAGDVVWTPPGLKHWHGATATDSMTHIAIQERVDSEPTGKVVEWLEPVTDEQYLH